MILPDSRKTAYIVTGTTRGIGRCLAETILESGHRLFSISSAGRQSDGRWLNVNCDLSRPQEVVDALQQVLNPIEALAPDRLVLINNAGLLAPMGPMETAEPDGIVGHLNVNVGAPAILMSGFIRRTESFAGERSIINISSGAARSPYAGWSYYCAAKAALDMLTRCAAAEQVGRARPVEICALYPGKVDTGMQRQIRQADPAHFPTHELFVRAKQNGELLSPDHVARLIVALDQAGHLKNGGMYDLRSAEIDTDGRVAGVVRVEG